MDLILASNNKDKLREVREVMCPLGYSVISQSEAGIHLDVCGKLSHKGKSHL